VLARNVFRGWGLLLWDSYWPPSFPLFRLTTSMGVSREERKMNVYIAQTAVRFFKASHSILASHCISLDPP
jgi:hypothetical protein